MKKVVLSSLLLLLSAGVAARAQTPAAGGGEVVDRMVAVVNGSELITYSDLLWQIALQPGAPLDSPRTVLRARTDGVVFGRLFSRIARPGTAFLSIAGMDPAKVPDNLGDPYP